MRVADCFDNPLLVDRRHVHPRQRQRFAPEGPVTAMESRDPPPRERPRRIIAVLGSLALAWFLWSAAGIIIEDWRQNESIAGLVGAFGYLTFVLLLFSHVFLGWSPIPRAWREAAYKAIYGADADSHTRQDRCE
jgi:hypothetical protein